MPAEAVDSGRVSPSLLSFANPHLKLDVLKPTLEEFNKAWKFQGKLGAGAFAEVWRVRNVLEGKEYALKILRVDAKKDIMMFFKEARALKAVEHRAVVKSYGLIQIPAGAGAQSKTSARWGLLQELCKDGTIKRKVYDSLCNSFGMAYTELDALRWCCSVAEGLDYMHSLEVPMIHRDIKLDNIVLYRPDPSSSDLDAKLTDFGLHQVIDSRKAPAMLVMREGMASSAPSRLHLEIIDEGNAAAINALSPPLKTALGTPLNTLTIHDSSGSCGPASEPALSGNINLRISHSQDSPLYTIAIDQGLINSGNNSMPGLRIPVHSSRTSTPRSSLHWTSQDTTQRLILHPLAHNSSSLSHQLHMCPAVPPQLLLRMHSCIGLQQCQPPHISMARHSFVSPAAYASMVQLRDSSVGLQHSDKKACSHDTISMGGSQHSMAHSLSAPSRGSAASGVAVVSINQSPTPDKGPSLPSSLPTPKNPSDNLQALQKSHILNETMLMTDMGCVSCKLCNEDVPSVNGPPETTFMDIGNFDLAFDLTGATGSTFYMAPEVYLRQPYNEKADVFSFGILMYEIFSCTMLAMSLLAVSEPYAAAMKYAKGVSEGERPPHVAKIPDNIWALIQACWDQNPGARPDMHMVVQELRKFQAASKEGQRRANRGPNIGAETKAEATDMAQAQEMDMAHVKGCCIIA